MTDEEQDLLTEIENRLEVIEGTVRLMLAMRLIADGHAKDLRTALRIARDPAWLRAIYPEAMSETDHD